MGRLSDFHYFTNIDEDTIVAVINYDDTKKTLIREYISFIDNG